MPILFIICGVFLFLILFDVIHFNIFKNKIILISILILFMISFFVGDLSLYDITINVLEVTLLVFLLLFFRSRVSAFSFIIAFLISFIYLLILTLPVSKYVLNNFSMFMLFSLIPALFVKEYKGKNFLIIIELILITVISSYFEYSILTFISVDLLDIFNVIFIFNLFCLIKKFIGGSYVKKTNNYFSFSCDKYFIC